MFATMRGIKTQMFLSCLRSSEFPSYFPIVVSIVVSIVVLGLALKILKV